MTDRYLHSYTSISILYLRIALKVDYAGICYSLLLIKSYNMDIRYCISNVFTVKECQSLGSPLHGQVHCPNGHIYGSSCSYSCHAGYTLTTGSSRICQHNSQFSGSEATCTGQFIQYMYLFISCSLYFSKNVSVCSSVRQSTT